MLYLHPNTRAGGSSGNENPKLYLLPLHLPQQHPDTLIFILLGSLVEADATLMKWRLWCWWRGGIECHGVWRGRHSTLSVLNIYTWPLASDTTYPSFTEGAAVVPSMQNLCTSWTPCPSLSRSTTTVPPHRPPCALPLTSGKDANALSDPCNASPKTFSV